VSLCALGYLWGPDCGDQATVVNDGQIAHVLETALRAQIDAGRTARTTSKNSNVQSFADATVAAHQKALDQLTALARTSAWRAEDNELSRQLNQHCMVARSLLSDAGPGGFDRTFVDTQLGIRMQLIEVIDETLLLRVSDPALLVVLRDTRETLVRHLDRADRLRTELSESGPPAP
jgi:predicted outer membrane protein